jgi:hypothetical protein
LIHKILCGKSFKLYEYEGKKAFLSAGGRGPEGCPGVRCPLSFSHRELDISLPTIMLDESLTVSKVINFFATMV